MYRHLMRLCKITKGRSLSCLFNGLSIYCFKSLSKSSSFFFRFIHLRVQYRIHTHIQLIVHMHTPIMHVPIPVENPKYPKGPTSS